MKVTVNNKEESKEIKYPCLMEFEENIKGKLIVYMTAPEEGFVLYDESNEWEKGEFSNEWIECRFKPFKGTITLSNE